MATHDTIRQKAEPIICPNCGGSDMEEIDDFFTTMDHLEWHTYIATGLVICFPLAIIGILILHFLHTIDVTTWIFSYTYFPLMLLVASLIPLQTVTKLSAKRARRDGICIWYVRCTKCLSHHRIVRPFGTVPPWETVAEEAEFEPLLEEVSHEMDS